jgi:hypothetical protein
MAYSSGANILSFTSGADLTSSQYRFVKIDSSTGKVVAGTAGDDCIGIVLNKPNTDEAASVAVEGICKLYIADHTSITYDSNLMAGSGGGGDLAAGSTNNVLAKALEDPGANGEIISVLIHKIGPLP